jgi:N-acetylmuramoyl-L-alanine amidase
MEDTKMHGSVPALAALFVLISSATPVDARTNEIDILARTAYFEARSEGSKGMLAVAFVVRNRLQLGTFGKSVEEVVQSPAQFSVWLPAGHARRKHIPVDDPDWALARQAAKLALAGAVADPTKGSVFYHEKSVTPHWAHEKQFVLTLGRHRFYRERLH